jgi:hypothetical protein
MSMLKPATNKQAFAKIGLYGNAGSGKTYTAALVAIGLHQAAKLTKPVAFFDTEPAASWVAPLFKEAGIEFLVYDESRALKDLMAFMHEAAEACSIIIIDSITHVWRDAQESYLAKINEGMRKRGKREINALEFHHWRPIKSAWADFTDCFLSSKAHVIVCGRAGSIYEYQEKNDGSGKKELITVGTKMAVEKELGYEPSLLIEMIADRDGGKIVNTALVQKDRSAKLNGAEIKLPNFEKLRPHFDSLNLGGEHFESMETRNSKELFNEDGNDNWSAEQRQRAIMAEEIQGLLTKQWPGQTAAEKAAKSDAIFAILKTRSWTKVENTNSDTLQAAFHELRKYIADLNGDAVPPAAAANSEPAAQEAAA